MELVPWSLCVRGSVVLSCWLPSFQVSGEKERQKSGNAWAPGSCWASFCTFVMWSDRYQTVCRDGPSNLPHLCVHACLHCDCLLLETNSLFPLPLNLDLDWTDRMWQNDMCGFSALVSRGPCSSSCHPLGTLRHPCCGPLEEGRTREERGPVNLPAEWSLTEWQKSHWTDPQSYEK